MAQFLLGQIEELVGLDYETALVNCCLRTGLISLVLAAKAKEVIGRDWGADHGCEEECERITD
jgi:hypothetical protein